MSLGGVESLCFVRHPSQDRACARLRGHTGPHSDVLGVWRIPLVHRTLNAEEAKRLSPDLTPINATPEERRAANAAITEENPMEPVVSPTGTPIVAGTSILLKVAAVLVAIAGAAITMDLFPESKLDEKVFGLIIAVGAALGIYSPGVRK
jgi:hypothetical protein